MSNNPLIQYWDSDVIISAIQRTPDRITEIDPFIREAESGNLIIVLSAFSLMEVYKDIDGVNVTSKVDDDKIVAFFENPFFSIRDLTIPIALDARQISRQFNVKPKDAVHVATALKFKVPTLFTYDKGLLKIDGRLGNPVLQIIEPRWTGQQALFGKDLDTDEEKEGKDAVEKWLKPNPRPVKL